MGLEVKGFENHKNCAQYDRKILGLPLRWVSWFEEEVHAANTKYAPVMKTVFEDVCPGHRVVAKSMHK